MIAVYIIAGLAVSFAATALWLGCMANRLGIDDDEREQ